jgi:hypothetical protein
VAITGVLPKTNLALSASVAFIAAPGTDQPLTTVAVRVQRPASAADGTGAPGARAAEMTIAAFGRRGQPVATARQSVDLARPSAAAGVTRYDVVTHLALKPGHYDLRIAATDTASQETGSVHTTIDVPNVPDDRLSLSDIVLTRGATTTGLADAALAAVLPVMPTPERAFTPDRRVTMFLRVHQPAKGPLLPVPLVIRVIDASDRVVVETSATLEATQFSATRTSDYQLDLPVSELGAGEYLLRITAGGPRDPLQRDLRFSVGTR